MPNAGCQIADAAQRPGRVPDAGEAPSPRGALDRGPAIWHLPSGFCNLESSIWNLASAIWLLESRLPARRELAMT